MTERQAGAEPAAGEGREPDAIDAEGTIDGEGAIDGSGGSLAEPVAPGLTTFTIEGRRAPALFLVGWLGTILGLGIGAIALLSGGGLASGVLFGVGMGLLAIGLICAAGSQAIERQAAGRPDYAGPSPVLVFAAAIPTTIVLQLLVGTPLVGLGLDPRGPEASFLAIAVTAVTYVVLLRLLVVGTGALGWAEMGVVAPSAARLREFAWGAVLAVPVLTAAALVAVVLSSVLPTPPSPLPPAGDLPGRLLNVVSGAVIAPIGEELFFRGFATVAWLRVFGAQGALIRGSLFFALVHVLFVGGSTAGEGLALAVFAFLVRLPVAFALGWLFLRQRTLWGVVGLHAAYNGVPLLAIALT